MDVQYQKCTYVNDATLLFFKVRVLAYGRTDSHVTPNFVYESVTKFPKEWVGAQELPYLIFAKTIFFAEFFKIAKSRENE